MLSESDLEQFELLHKAAVRWDRVPGEPLNSEDSRLLDVARAHMGSLVAEARCLRAEKLHDEGFQRRALSAEAERDFLAKKLAEVRAELEAALHVEVDARDELGGEA